MNTMTAADSQLDFDFVPRATEREVSALRVMVMADERKRSEVT